MTTERSKTLAGELYAPLDPELVAGRERARDLCRMLDDTRAGAGGIIGMELGRKEAPDGYTVMTASAGILAINPFLYAKLPYDPVRDFAPVSMGAFFAHILTVHPSLPVKSVKDLVALAKSRAGQLAYGSAGVGTPNHLAGELFKMTTGTNLVHVPYKGAADSLVALLGGHVSLMFAPVAMALPHGESGKLRLLATTTLKRPDYVPNLPTMSEAGISGYEVIAWNGFVVPAGTPQPVVAKLNADIVRILRAPDIKQQLLAGGDEPWATTPDEFARIIRSGMVKWSQVVRESGARAN